MTDKTRGLIHHNRLINKVVRESLEEALVRLMGEKPYNKITITDVCNRAGVSRMAFYANYGSVDSLLESIVVAFNMNTIVRRIGNPFTDGVGYGWYVRLFETVKASADFFNILFAAGFKYKYLSVVNGLALGRSPLAAPNRYARMFWVGGIVNTLIYWLEGGMEESVEDIAQFCADNLPKMF